MWPAKDLNSLLPLNKNQPMKQLLLLLSLACLPVLASAQVVFETEWRNEADYVVYVTDWESEADVVVYKTEWRSETSQEGVWMMSEWRNEADFSVYFTEWRSEADIVVYFTEWRNEAGWRNESKKRH